mgnify:CR=1 FL=1
MNKVLVLGGGSWGTTLANLLAEKGHDVSILKGGYGYCAECGYEIEGYSTLYLPPKGFVMPGDEYGE